jgi:hypothetical protein
MACVAIMLATTRTEARGIAANGDVIQGEDSALVVASGEGIAFEEPVEFKGGIVVNPDGTFSVAEKKARQLKEGDVLKANGLLVKPNGSAAYVFDHVVRDRGRMYFVENGERRAIGAALTLGNGMVVHPDGRVKRPGISESRLLDGHTLLPNGTFLAAKNTVTLRKGSVVVTRGGAAYTLKPRQTMMMDDGTRIYGSGKIVYRDKRTVQLAENQIIAMDGVVAR